MSYKKSHAFCNFCVYFYSKPQYFAIKARENNFLLTLWDLGWVDLLTKTMPVVRQLSQEGAKGKGERKSSN
jgi:hypothetical protein